MSLRALSWLFTSLLHLLWPPISAPPFKLDSHLFAVYSGSNFVYVLTQEHSRKVVLVGSGSDPQATELQRQLHELDRTLEDVAWVLLPCGHAAHTAGLKALPHAQVGAAMAEAPLIWGQSSPRAPLQRLLLRLHGRVRIQPDIVPVVPGQRLRVGDETISVVSLAGHTQGSLGFVVHDVLLGGETLDTKTLADEQLFALPGFDEKYVARRDRRQALKQQLRELGARWPLRSIADATSAETLFCAAL